MADAMCSGPPWAVVEPQLETTVSLWTPGGEHEVPREEGGPTADPTAPDGEMPRLTDEQFAEAAQAAGIDPGSLSAEERERAEQMLMQMAQAQAEMLATPIEVLIAHHVMGFYELAVLHLQQPEPDLGQAKTAIDAMAGVVAALPGELGDAEATLHQALQQAQTAYVTLAGGDVGGEDDD